MYCGKHEKRVKTRKTVMLLLSLVLILSVTVGGTLAWLFVTSDDVVNTFEPTKVTTKIEEEFDGEKKSKVNAVNTGEIDAFIRVKLVTYRVNEAGERIGGTAEIPYFEMGSGWVKHTDGFYYFADRVAPGKPTSTYLIGETGIKLKDYSQYPSDPDGGCQVIEVMAEAIQADGVDENGNKPIELAWGVDIEDGKLTTASIVE